MAKQKRRQEPVEEAVNKVQKYVGAELENALNFVSDTREAFIATVVVPVSPQKVPESGQLKRFITMLDEVIKDINSFNEYQKKLFAGKMYLAAVTPKTVNLDNDHKVVADFLDKTIREVKELVREVVSVEIAANSFPHTPSPKFFEDRERLQKARQAIDELKMDSTEQKEKRKLPGNEIINEPATKKTRRGPGKV